MSAPKPATPSAADKNLSPFERGMKKWGVLVAAIVFCILFFMPTPEGLSLEGQKAMAIFASALVLWVSNPFPAYITSLITIIMLTLTGAYEEKAVLGVFGLDVIWLMVCAFILTSVMIKSNFARRFALWMVTTFGKEAKWALLSLIVVNLGMAFLIPSTTARAAILLPIVMVLAEVYKANPGKSNFGKALMIQGVQANSVSTSGIMTATACNIMAVGFIKDMTGTEIYYTDWLMAALPIAIITLLGAWFVGLKMFPPENKTPCGDGIEGLKSELKQMGRLTLNEKKAGAIFLIAILLWFSDKYHEAIFGFQISTTMVAIIVATIALLPKIGVIQWSEAKIPWDLMIFSAGAYAAGTALEKTEAAQWLIQNLIDSMGLESMGPAMVYIIVVLIAMFSHFVFTSKTVRTTIVIPAAIALAQTMGMDPVGVGLAAAITMTYSITLPPHAKPNLIYYSTGYFSVTDMLKYGIVTCVIGSALIIAAGFTWFKWLGFGF